MKLADYSIQLDRHDWTAFCTLICYGTKVLVG